MAILIGKMLVFKGKCEGCVTYPDLWIQFKIVEFCQQCLDLVDIIDTKYKRNPTPSITGIAQQQLYYKYPMMRLYTRDYMFRLFYNMKSFGSSLLNLKEKSQSRFDYSKYQELRDSNLDKCTNATNLQNPIFSNS